jgi:predicted PurR-regulated permease PerM
MTRFELRVPFATLLKIALFLLLVLITIRLEPMLIMIVVAVLITVVLEPLRNWLEGHGVRRSLAIFLIALVLFAIVGGLLFGVVPMTISEMSKVVRALPEKLQRVSQEMPAARPYIDTVLAQMKQPGKGTPAAPQEWIGGARVAGRVVVSGIWAIIFTLAVALYLLVEGKRLMAWLFSFAPEPQRKKLVQTAEEVQPIALAYMRGQLITSTASAVVSFVTLTALGVPGAVPLAVLAFLGDFVPVVGFIAALVPAVLLALMKGPAAAIIVLAVYVAYQTLENYVIVPKVYGSQMELSTLTVLLCITAGGTLLGPIGAILFLPFAAAYPAVERIWFRDKLPPDTVPKHEAIQSNDEHESEVAQDRVLRK